MPVFAVTVAPRHQRDRIRDRLRIDTNLNDAALQALDPEVTEYAKRGGTELRLREMVRTAQGAGCTGECLVSSLRAMNRAMERSAINLQAQHMVEAAIREEARARTAAPDEGQRIQARVESRLDQRDRRRDAEHVAHRHQGLVDDFGGFLVDLRRKELRERHQAERVIAALDPIARPLGLGD